MLNLYLGNYLLRKGLLSSETLKEMLDLEKNTRLRLGVLAMHEGLMTSQQVEETHLAQRNVDAKFGEVAIGKGFLTEDQRDQLLQHQVQGGAKLAQILMDKGIFTASEMEGILSDYREENNLTQEELKALEQGDADQLLIPYVKLQCDLAGIPHHDVLSAYSTLFMRNLIRFVDHKAILDIENHRIPAEDFRVFCQKIQGGVSLTAYLAMDNETYYPFAEKHGNLPIHGEEALAAASVTEFLNLHNGLFTVWLSDASKPSTLLPPEVVSALPDPETDPCIAVQFQTNFGAITLMVVSAAHG